MSCSDFEKTTRHPARGLEMLVKRNHWAFLLHLMGRGFVSADGGWMGRPFLGGVKVCRNGVRQFKLK